MRLTSQVILQISIILRVLLAHNILIVLFIINFMNFLRNLLLVSILNLCLILNVIFCGITGWRLILFIRYLNKLTVLISILCLPFGVASFHGYWFSSVSFLSDWLSPCQCFFGIPTCQIIHIHNFLAAMVCVLDPLIEFTHCQIKLLYHLCSFTGAFSHATVIDLLNHNFILFVFIGGLWRRWTHTNNLWWRLLKLRRHTWSILLLNLHLLHLVEEMMCHDGLTECDAFIVVP